MIKYFIDLFTKPLYKWSFLDDLALIGLIILIAIIIGIIWFIIWFILDIVKKHKYKNCEKYFHGMPCYHHQDCLNCPCYKNKNKKGEQND